MRKRYNYTIEYPVRVASGGVVLVVIKDGKVTP